MSNDESSWKCPFAHDGNSPMRLGTVPSGHVSVSEAILHFASHAREAAVWGKLGTSWDRFRLRPELPSPASAPLCQPLTSCSGLPPGHPATLPFLRAATPGPGRSPTFQSSYGSPGPAGRPCGLSHCRRERPKALMASLLWFSTFHRREDSAKVPSGIRQVWRTGAP